MVKEMNENWFVLGLSLLFDKNQFRYFFNLSIKDCRFKLGIILSFSYNVIFG